MAYKEEFQIDYKVQDNLKIAIEMAISYCEEHIPNADGWSRQGLESHLSTFKDLKDSIGNSFVAGSYR